MKLTINILLLFLTFAVFTHAQTLTKEEIAKKIADATPQSLPQTPVVKKLKSDAEDDGLKGKVKSVALSEEDLSGTWVTKGSKMSSESFYDEKGNLIKYVYYDYRGNPSNILVYGYLDRMRVSRTGFINYSYNPPPIAMPSSGKSNSEKSVDNRFNTRYEYKYDDKGRLIESISYRNTGEIINKTVVSYNGNKLEKTWFDENGKSYSKIIDLLDNKSNIIEHTFVYLDSSKPSNITVYNYDSFDDKGNWTKRTIKWKDVENNSNRQTNYIQYRTITYYP